MLSTMAINKNPDLYNTHHRVPLDGSLPSPEDILIADERVDEALTNNEAAREIAELLGLDRKEIRWALLAYEG